MLIHRLISTFFPGDDAAGCGYDLEADVGSFSWGIFRNNGVNAVHS